MMPWVLIMPFFSFYEGPFVEHKPSPDSWGQMSHLLYHVDLMCVGGEDLTYLGNSISNCPSVFAEVNVGSLTKI